MQKQSILSESYNRTILDAILFYADSADLVTAAHIILIFYGRFHGLKQEAYLQRVLASYYYMLQQL